MISIKYVRGDINANGADEIGINNGLIKISGNFTKMVRIIVLAGVSVGGTDNIKLKLEKAKAAMIIPIMMIKMFKDDHNPKMIIPKIIGIVENIQPKKNELQTLPSKIVFIEIGHAINRSRVFCRVSHGNTTGPIDVEVKNKTIAISPEII